LTAVGRHQAETTARWLQSTFDVTGIATSPLRRALETTTPIATLVGLEAAVDVRLRERMNWEGEHEQTLEAFLSEWHRASADRSFVPRSGDSSHQAADRLIAAIDELADTAGEQGQVVVVSHGGVTVDLLRTLVGDEHLRAQQPSLIDHGVPSCAVTTLCRESDRWSLVALPSTIHLDRQIDHRPA
jgi:broad specificity phosphatase PhoE